MSERRIFADKSHDHGGGVIGASPADIVWANSFCELPIEREIETPKSTSRLADAFSSFFDRLSLPIHVGMGASALTLAILGAVVASAGSSESSVDASNDFVTPVERDLLSNEGVKNNETVDKPSVRAVYLVPADREVNPDYAQGIDNAMYDIQKWFHDHLDSQKTFRLHSPNVITVQSSHNSDWFRNNITGVSERHQFFVNVNNDANSLLPVRGDADKRVIFVDADSTPDQGGALGGGSVAVLDGDYLRGLSGEFTPDEGQAHNTVFGNIGSTIHELGHIFGLNHHDEECTDVPCLIMVHPRDYPMVSLDKNEEAILNASSLFDFQFIESDLEFQVEIRMFNLAEAASKEFFLNGVYFMQMHVFLDTGRVDISNWTQPSKNVIEMESYGFDPRNTHGFEIYIDDLLVYGDPCGVPDVPICDSSIFNDTFSFEAPMATATPRDTDTPTQTLTITETPTELPFQPDGDVNCDGTTNAIDAALILQYSAGLIDVLECDFNGDVSRDGAISSVDAALVLQFSSGLINFVGNQSQ